MRETIWPTILLKGLIYGNLNILFGAGLGFEFGFPMWKDLLNRIYNAINYDFTNSDKQEFVEFMNSNDYLEAMEFLMDKNEEGVLDKIERIFIKEEYSKRQSENSNLYYLLNLGAHSYITTNIDNSFNELKSYTGHNSSKIYPYTNEEGIKDRLIVHDSDKNPLFIRLHGEIDDKSSLVFSKKQYQKIILGSSYIFNHVLPAIFLTSVTLIVGYSMSDPDLHLVLENLNLVKGTRKNIFLLNTSPSLSEFKKRKLEERFGVKVIDIFEREDNQTEALKIHIQDLLKIKKNACAMNPKELKELLAEDIEKILDRLRCTEITNKEL